MKPVQPLATHVCYQVGAWLSDACPAKIPSWFSETQFVLSARSWSAALQVRTVCGRPGHAESPALEPGLNIQCTAWSTPRQALDLQEILTLSSSESHTQPISAYAVQPGYLRFTSCAGVSNAGRHGCKDLSASSETIQGQRSVPHGRTPGRGARAGKENSHCDILLQLFKLYEWILKISD